MAESGGLAWEGVGFTYEAAPPVVALQPTDLELAPGEQVALVGPSGSGKSTALNVFGLLDRPTEGAYWLFGRDTAALRESERAGLRCDAIGFVFQSFHLLAQRTALENVLLGMMYSSVPRSERRARAEAALAQVGLGHRRHAPAATLSGGEKQRAAIARAICHRPQLLLADEPTGNLDQATGSEILDLLADLMTAELVQVIVTHDPAVAARCDRHLEIVDGRIEEPSVETGVVSP